MMWSAGSSLVLRPASLSDRSYTLPVSGIIKSVGHFPSYR
jgi:hypothetical protein